MISVPLEHLQGEQNKLFKLLKRRLASDQSPATFELPVPGKDQRLKILEVTLRVQRLGR